MITISGVPELLQDDSFKRLLHVQDLKAVNVDGGTFTGASYETRDLNTITSSGIPGATLVNNQIILSPGTYYAEFVAPAFDVGRHKGYFYDVTANTTRILGSAEHADLAGNVGNSSVGAGKFTIVVESAIEIRHRGATTKTTIGFGCASNQGSFQELYTDVRIWPIDETGTSLDNLTVVTGAFTESLTISGVPVSTGTGGGGASTLQEAYDGGDGTIATTGGKPFELTGTGELVAVTGTFTDGLTVGGASTFIDGGSITTTTGTFDEMTVGGTDVSATNLQGDITTSGIISRKLGLDHNPVALYLFDDNLTDSSGNGLDMTLDTGNEWYTSTNGLRCAKLDGQSSFIHDFTGTALEIAGDITIQVLLTMENQTGLERFIVNYAGPVQIEVDNALYALSYLSNGERITWTTEFGSGPTADVVNFDAAGIQELHLVTVVRASDVVTVFIDGIQVGASSATLTTPTGGTTAVFEVGGLFGNGFFRGSVACVKIIDSALTDAQVYTEYRSTWGVSEGINLTVAQDLTAVSGTFAQSLTVSGSPVLIADAIGPVPGYRGARVFTSSGISLADGVTAFNGDGRLPFDSVVFDTDGFFDTAHEGRFVIPAGINKVEVTYSVSFSADVDGDRVAFLSINGGTAGSMRVAPALDGADTRLYATTGVLEVVEGDIITPGARHTGGVTLTLAASTATNYNFSLEVIDPVATIANDLATISGSFTQSLTISGVPVSTGAGGGGSALTIRTPDSAPSVSDVSEIVVASGSLYDDGAGQVTIGPLPHLFAMKQLSGGTFAIATGFNVVVAWNEVQEDTDGIDGPSGLVDGTSDGFVIPEHLTNSWWVAKAQIQWESETDTNVRALTIFGPPNHRPRHQFTNVNNGDLKFQSVVSAPFMAPAGTHIRVALTHNTGTDKDIGADGPGGSAASWFSLERVSVSGTI